MNGFCLIWQTDITDIKSTNHIWGHLVTVFDSEEIKAVNYKIDDTMSAGLAASGLKMTLCIYRKALITYLDMESQYTSVEFSI